MRTPLLMITASLVLCGAAQAATLDVCPTGCTYSSIQDAIDASSDGDVIEIAAGTYYEYEVNPGGRAITIRGAMNKDGTPATAIDAQGDGRVVICNSGETESLRFENLIITGGTTTYGGGMYNNSSSPTLTNCTFSNNTTEYSGGGMYNRNSSPTLTNCTFNNNSGGGMFNFNGSNPILENCTFNDNTTGSSGGGMINSSSSPILENCTFNDNTAGSSGGGMFNFNGSPTLTNCTFAGNTAENSAGGGMNNQSRSKPTLIYCTFTSNTADNYGGGMYSYDSTPTLQDSLFCGNIPDHIEAHGGQDAAWIDMGWNLFWLSCSDCNENGIDDQQDIADGTVTDVDKDGIPDECEYDCDGDGTPDPIEIYLGQATDIDADSHPDNCQDCDLDGYPDSWAIEVGIAQDCDQSGVPDACEADCNDNGVQDSCDIDKGTSADVNGDGIPDDCQSTCDLQTQTIDLNVNTWIDSPWGIDMDDTSAVVWQWDRNYLDPGGDCSFRFFSIVDGLWSEEDTIENIPCENALWTPGQYVAISNGTAVATLGPGLYDSHDVAILSNQSGDWTLLQVLPPQGEDNDFEGLFVAIDHDVIAVSGDDGDTSFIYVYRQLGTTWIIETELTTDLDIGSLSVSENTILACNRSGTGHLFDYDEKNTNWSKSQIIETEAASAGDLNGDNLIIGLNTYVRNGIDWHHEQTLELPSGMGTNPNYPAKIGNGILGIPVEGDGLSHVAIYVNDGSQWNYQSSIECGTPQWYWGYVHAAAHGRSIAAGIFSEDNWDTPFDKVKIHTETCQGDLDCDGLANVNDLLAVIAGWGDPYNVDDLLLVIGAWGECP